MKKLFIATFIAGFLAAASCLAQGSVSVTLTTTTSAGTCSFSATSVSEDVIHTVTTTNGTSNVGKPTLDPITLTKVIDKCSVPLYHDFFLGTPITKVVISFFSSANAAAGSEVLRLTLTKAFVMALTDADSAVGPVERVTLQYGAVSILDPIDGTTSVCDATTNTCS
jgi:type VI protein secretion system component Hcp